ncbi:MAG: hypothetical protein WBX25_12885, partial [Rhodomicrobium sp.]
VYQSIDSNGLSRAQAVSDAQVPRQSCHKRDEWQIRYLHCHLSKNRKRQGEQRAGYSDAKLRLAGLQQ